MNRKSVSDKGITTSVLLFFALALLIVGMILRTRIGMFIRSYAESQTSKQAETFALLVEEKLDTELENLEYIASILEHSPDDMDDIMPVICNEQGIRQGLLTIDQKALYGESLDFRVFEGIHSSFRGRKVMTYVRGEGLLFTVPVFDGPNIHYVLYRLCPEDILRDYLGTEVYGDRGKLCVVTRDGEIVVPFYNENSEDTAWYKSSEIQGMYASMHLEMEVSVAVARSFSTDCGTMLLFEAEIPGTDFMISGYVPKTVAAEGIGNITLLVVWVFGLLMLLVMIGAFYLARASIRIRESDELREAKALAEEASRAKSNFLANMSHEIRTPINAVLGMDEMILRESSDEAITAYASNIKTAGNTLLGIINDILDFSKIESGKIEINPVDYELISLMKDLVNMIRTRVENKGLLLKLDFDEALPEKLNGDDIRIRQIITNILTNAVKYTEKGSVTFHIGFKRIEDEPDSVMLDVSVSDTGIGIREEDLQKLFIQFERIEENRNRNIEGTGLGMSITKSLLEMMGSSLEVRSVYGEGSTFSFLLKQKVISWEPVGNYEISSGKLQAAREQYHEKFTAPDAHILVVDDNPMNLMVFKSLVKQTRIKTDTAENGDEGIALTLKNRYDMIFLDHMMPVKDGIETLKEIRNDPDNPNVGTPAVCLTANAIAGAKEEYISAGFDDYLSKPVDADKLEKMMIAFLPDELVIKRERGDEETAEEITDIPEELAGLADSPIDTGIGLKNSGNWDAYIALLKVFYESIDSRADELSAMYNDMDYKNYTIKVHALKSSARIIGAAELGEEAQRLENAGKTGDTGYIHEHHDRFMEEYVAFSKLLSPIFADDEDESEKQEADEALMEKTFEDISMAAEEMDCDKLEEIFNEMQKYRIPKTHFAMFMKLRDAAEQYDYDMILELMQKK